MTEFRGWGVATIVIGLIVVAIAMFLPISVSTELPDLSTYSYLPQTHTVDLVNLDKVRIQALVYNAGLAVTLIGVVLASIGHLGVRLGIQPPVRVEHPAMFAPAPSATAAVDAPELSDEEIEEAREKNRRDDRLMLAGIIAIFAITILAAWVFTIAGAPAPTSKPAENATSTAAPVNATEPAVAPKPQHRRHGR